MALHHGTLQLRHFSRQWGRPFSRVYLTSDLQSTATVAAQFHIP